MKIGLLPLYIKLYDEKLGYIRKRSEAFYSKIADLLRSKGMDVIEVPFCRVKSEFEAAVRDFEDQGADAVVTLHMAYSPSLESIDALCATKLPLVVLDTTETYAFDGGQSPAEIDYNHGIHGVMDMCSMLMQRGKPYEIAAGHYETSDCIDRACGYVKAAVCAKALKGAKVGLIGGAFDGMGDFAVPSGELKEKFGISVITALPDLLRSIAGKLTLEETEKAISADKERFSFGSDIDTEEYKASVRSGLTVRRWLEQEKLTAFSVNFLAVGEQGGLETIPFIECCKAMERGVGYAGEGDALTAAFVGALLQGYRDTTFAEIFCPDWKNNALFLSHMGEMNYRIAGVKPVIQRQGVNFTPGCFPYVGYTRMKSGRAVFVNVSRGADSYKLVISPVEVIDCDEDNFEGCMRGWIKPEKTTAEFLEALSENGVTHHSILVYDARVKELCYLGKLLGIQTIIV